MHVYDSLSHMRISSSSCWFKFFSFFLSVARGDTIEDQIIVGTPGTLLDWCVKFKAVNMQSIRVFVLDEADVMISQQGHQDQSIRLQR